jgi:hypothetical protein
MSSNPNKKRTLYIPYEGYISKLYNNTINNIELLLEGNKIFNSDKDGIMKNLIELIQQNQIKNLSQKLIILDEHLHKNDLYSLLVLAEEINKNLEEQIKNNKNISPFLFYNIFNLTIILIFIITQIYYNINYKQSLHLFHMNCLFVLIIILFLQMFIDINKRYPPVFYQKFILQKNIEIIKLLDKCHNDRI